MAQGLLPHPEVCFGKVTQDKGNLSQEKISREEAVVARKAAAMWSGHDRASPAPGVAGSQGGSG